MTIRDRLHDPELADTLAEALTAVQFTADGPALAAVAIACVEGHLAQASAPRRQFTAAHLRIVYLLAESGGATHTRLSRVWAAKASRKEHPWPWLSDSGIRTRTSELVAWGIVEDTGGKGESRFGRPSAIWTLIGVDPVALGRVVDEVPGVAEDLHDVMEVLLVEAGTDIALSSHLELAYTIARRRATIAA